MNLSDIQNILNNISYKETWSFSCGIMGDGFYIQPVFSAEDCKDGTINEQRGRKWYVSSFSTKSEVVQTTFKSIQVAEEHETREIFKYKGQAIFGPHFNCEELREFTEAATEDARQHLML